MNLYLRLVYVIASALRRGGLAFGDELTVTYRVLPNDLDVNGHMNNSRYLTMLDLAIVELFLRSKTLQRARRAGWRPLVGGSLISYRKSLTLWQRYTIKVRLDSWDERWNYFKFEFVARGVVYATGFVKGSMVGKNGLVLNTVSSPVLGIERDEGRLSEAVRDWIKAEQLAASMAPAA